MDIASKDEVEKCLRPAWQNVTFLTRDGKFAVLEVRFRSENEVRQYSTKSLKTSEMVLLLTYRGRHTSKILSDVDVAKLVADITMDLEDKIFIL